jgi:hypothetical protein
LKLRFTDKYNHRLFPRTKRGQNFAVWQGFDRFADSGLASALLTRIGHFHYAHVGLEAASGTLIHKDIFHEFEVRHRGLAQRR